MHSFSDPPPPPPFPKNADDLLRVEAKQSVVCRIEMALTDLGIKRTGTFTVTGFWQGVSLKASELDLKNLNFSFTHAETIKLRVTAARPANNGLQPTAPAPVWSRPKCAAAEAGR